ncbi:HD domain-containing protein [Haloechinothrix sp. LS1_15]|uniref:HD domain-containing protein n=1 Tax=Haloechinothrix sp. LS1_15 TaxID=2652248 RepID=UPI00294677AE|nr:HD domain-containing protein [Haloechinothrix sp. LS1_15]MDV6011105.1 HD domain-containing protein [Haloechinothrix sp. LS1_15]
MDSAELSGILEFLKRTERLKDTTRTAHTSQGRQESVAEHTWRLCLMASLLHEHRPEIDLAKLLRMCLIHDLGEAVNGDIPAPEQAAGSAKAQHERADLLHLTGSLPSRLREEIVTLWDEYEAGATPEAAMVKGLDKLETILQHVQGRNPESFDYRFNLSYGQQYTAHDEVIVALRRTLDGETANRAAAAETGDT